MARVLRWGRYVCHLVLLHMSGHGVVPRVAIEATVATVRHHIVSSTFPAEEVASIRCMGSERMAAVLLVEGDHAAAGAIASHVIRRMVPSWVPLGTATVTIVGLGRLLVVATITPLAVVAAKVPLVLHVGRWMGCVGRRCRGLLVSPVADGNYPLVATSRGGGARVVGSSLVARRCRVRRYNVVLVVTPLFFRVYKLAVV